MAFAVSDTGCGMDAVTRERICEPFFTTRSEDQGTGLGLSLVEEIVDRGDGRLVVASEPGRGTCITVLWPAAEAGSSPPSPGSQTDAFSPEGGEAPGGSATDATGARILVVDDEESVRCMLERYLGALGYATVPAVDGVEALRLFRDDPERWDAVISDQIMPGLRGSELATQLLGERPELPVILVSGYAPELDDAQLQTLGVRGLLKKPIRLPRLRALLAEALEPPAEPT